MRSVILATSVALALGSAPAIARTGLSRVTAANGSGPSTTTTTTTTSSAATEPQATAAPSASSTGSSSAATAIPATGSGTALGTNTTTRIPTNSTPSFSPSQPTPTFSIVNTPTPTFDLAAREDRAKENARKARGQEPRVYGIAPRTADDLACTRISTALHFAAFELGEDRRWWKGKAVNPYPWLR